MAVSLDDSGLWLPSHFLEEEDKLKSSDCGSHLCFPTGFPYEVDSPVSSSSDDDDFLSGLTRSFAQSSFHDNQSLAGRSFASDKPEKNWVSAGSPQSTLSGIGCLSGDSAVSNNGSPNGTSLVSSPPATPLGFSNDTWELIYAAAGEVARLKMRREAAKLSNHQGMGLLGPRSIYSHQPTPLNIPLDNQFHQWVTQDHSAADWGRQVKAAWPTRPHHQQKQVYNRNGVGYVGYENRGCGSTLNLSNSTCHRLPTQHRNGPAMRSAFPGGTVAKRESTGTGVFLPRRYTIPSECSHKTGCSPVLVPAKVVRALNLNFNDVNGHAQPRAGGGVAPDHEALVARRNALLMQQKRAAPEVHLRHEVRLPQEWTYGIEI